MANSAESNFRNAFKSFGARGGISVTDNASASSDSGAFSRASDWFGGVRSQVSGYVPVSLGGSSGQQQQQEEDFLGLTWFQRMAGFAICALGGIACFAIAIFLGLPALFILKPGKFATSFTFGSILMIFALLRGPMTHLRTIFSRERWHFTVTYFGSMAFTLFASLSASGVFGFFLTIIGSVIQIMALIWYFTSYSPFGTNQIRLGSRMTSLLPV
ncbi:hypothetical protein DFQ26_005183 [Actinomortierella ambigua]|nr:hypothetical protein DFQ26_005183 [Actinomortierella ambigua]